MSTTIEILSLAPAHASSQNPVVELLRNLLRNRSAIIGLVIIGFLITFAIFSPQIANYDPILSMIGQPGETGRLPAKPPCIGILGCSDTQHFFGLYLNARDIYSSIIDGPQTHINLPLSRLSTS